MKTVVINQPYFFPYFGYFAILSKSDVFISLDDVAMIKKGFIHRNSLIRNGSIEKFTIPINKVSQNKKINQTVTCGYPIFYQNFRQRVFHAYGKCDYYNQVEALLAHVEFDKDESISIIAEKSIAAVLNLLELDVQFFRSSQSSVVDVVGCNRIIKLCQSVEAKRYLNLPGGRELYRSDLFLKNGIEIKFIDIFHEQYKLFKVIDGVFPSILDAFAHYPVSQIRSALTSDRSFL